MPTVSVIVNTFRPGGIDITMAGLRDQTYRDFEAIIVDQRYEIRHAQVMALAREYGLRNIYHVPSHRTNSKWTVFCSAWNTGMAMARGDLIILLQDWAYAPAGFIESHLEAVDGKRRYVLAPYVYTEVPEINWRRDGWGTQIGEKIRDPEKEVDAWFCTEPDPILLGGFMDEIACFRDGLFDPHWLNQLPWQGYPVKDPRSHPKGPMPSSHDTWVHVKNESLLRSTAYELNGLDERLERGKGPMDIDLGIRLVAAGVELFWNPDAVSFAPNPRALIPSMPWGATTERLEGRWSWLDGCEYNKIRREETAHRGSCRAKNPYNIEDLALYLDGWRSGDLEPRSRDIGDLEYYGREIWPDTP